MIESEPPHVGCYEARPVIYAFLPVFGCLKTIVRNLSPFAMQWVKAVRVNEQKLAADAAGTQGRP